MGSMHAHKTRRRAMAGGALAVGGAACRQQGGGGDTRPAADDRNWARGVTGPRGEIRWMTRAATEAHRQIQLEFGPDFERRNSGKKVRQAGIQVPA
jgi:hypothetical protein